MTQERFPWHVGLSVFNENKDGFVYTPVQHRTGTSNKNLKQRLMEITTYSFSALGPPYNELEEAKVTVRCK